MNDVEKNYWMRLTLMKKYPDFDPPFSRTDGDLVIPLNSALKKNRKHTKDSQMRLAR